MKILKVEIEGSPLFKDRVDIDFVARQRVDDDDKEVLYYIFSNIYLNKVISFIGINASGKTTILKAISFVFNMLNNESINNIKSNEIFKDMSDNQKAIITSYFYKNKLVYKLETIIKKEVNNLDGSERFIILEEFLWSKDIRKIKTKKGIFEFKDSDLAIERNQKEQYLMDDISIIIAVNKIRNDVRSFYVRDLLNWTNRNTLHVMGNYPKELLIFLDPRIEYLKCEIDDKFRVDYFRLKFYDKEEIIISDEKMLEKYLSSGTIKGLGVFMSAFFAFCEGGYMIIDEIENHFNKEIVATLIRFFMDSRVNKNGATLIFSTHYSELLDEFSRNDGIYITRNKGGITACNLADVLKRNDLKKSEVYDSDYLGGTVPLYDAYMALKNTLISMMGRLR